MTSPLPRSPDEVGPDWLTHVLRAHAGLETVRVTTCAVEPMKDAGQTAEVVRIHLACDRSSGAPASLVAKFATRHAPTRELARRYNSYVNEVRFYNTLAKGRDLPVPFAYAAELHDDGDFVLLLEDLGDLRPGNPFRSSVDDVRAGLRHLARIHAAFWGQAVLDAQPWLRGPGANAWTAALKQGLSQLVPAVRTFVGDQFSPTTFAAIDTWLEVWDTIVGYVPDTLTLVHVDAHPAQMLFPTPRRQRFALLDWQQAARGWAAVDVARLLLTGLSTADRRAHERDLVAGYHAELQRGGVADLSLERLWFRVALASTSSFFINAVAALQTDVTSIASAAAAEGADWKACLFGRVDAAIKDWSVGDVLRAYCEEARAAQAKS
jgi:aminoglycoside/choline kinase family phosphotransferase